MKLSERIRKSMDDAEAGLAISWPIDQWATEVAQLEAENETLKRENEDLREFLRGVPHGQSLSANEQDELDALLKAED